VVAAEAEAERLATAGVRTVRRLRVGNPACSWRRRHTAPAAARASSLSAPLRSLFDPLVAALPADILAGSAWRVLSAAPTARQCAPVRRRRAVATSIPHTYQRASALPLLPSVLRRATLSSRARSHAETRRSSSWMPKKSDVYRQ